MHNLFNNYQYKNFNKKIKLRNNIKLDILTDNYI